MVKQLLRYALVCILVHNSMQAMQPKQSSPKKTENIWGLCAKACCWYCIGFSCFKYSIDILCAQAPQADLPSMVMGEQNHNVFMQQFGTNHGVSLHVSQIDEHTLRALQQLPYSRNVRSHRE